MGTRTALTWQEFLAAGKPDQRWEYIGGEIRFMSPTGGGHGIILRKISALLDGWGESHPDWIAFGADVAFTMSSGQWLCPDAAVVKAERFGTAGVPDGPVLFPPDFAFEVLSPGDTLQDTLDKRAIYLANHVTQVWIDLRKRMVEVVSPNSPPRYFREGEPVVVEELPDFSMNLFPIE